MIYFSIFRKIFLLLGALLILPLGSCSSGHKVEVSILVQSLPANNPDTPVDIYWSTRSLEAWLKLPGNPEKAPDLAQAQIVDTHWLWENLQTSREHGKVADLVVMGTISKKHPREWLLLELGNKARSLGAHTVVINSLQVVGLVGQAHRDDEEALITKGLNVSVRVYAQTFRFE